MYIKNLLKSLDGRPERIAAALFFCVTIGLCALPLLLTLFGMGPGRAEKEAVSERPAISAEGKTNIYYLSELGDHYSRSFAGRNRLLTLNNQIKSGVFMTSEVGGVIAGSDGWLYYRDTLSDYQGRDLLSDRQIFNIAENISLMQRTVEDNGASFIFVIAPNKNSLYGDNMPYYYNKTEGVDSNAERLAVLLEEKGIKYVDLFSMFKNSDDTLYLKKDSHWNNKGAAMVCNAVLRRVGRESEIYDENAFILREYPAGDLYQMLCPEGNAVEQNQDYDLDGILSSFEYTRRGTSVEDAIVNTSCGQGSGNLVMYRDSFGNSLLPFFASRFEHADFYRTQPYNIEIHMLTAAPDVVFVEKVERSLDELGIYPPVMTAPIVVQSEEESLVESEDTSDISCEAAEENMMFLKLGGSVDSKYISDRSHFSIEIDYDDYSELRQAFNVTLENGGQGFIAYLPASEMSGLTARVSIIIHDEDKRVRLAAKEMVFPELDFEEDE